MQKRILSLLFIAILLTAFCPQAISMSNFRGSTEEPVEPNTTVSVSVPVVSTPKCTAADANTITTAVDLMSKGEFSLAEKVVTVSNSSDESIVSLKAIISNYNDIMKARDTARKALLKEQMDKLAELKTLAEANEPNVLDVFPVVIKIQDFSTEADKNKILKDEFVKSMVKKSIDIAAGYESKGQWLEAMLNCYSWLSAIYEDNKTYDEYKETLTDKAILKGSLVDSPCESSGDRYSAVEAKMFIRALDVLEYAYVEPFYYSEMAEASLKTIIQLAEVLSYPESFDANTLTIDYVVANIPDFLKGIKKIQSEIKKDNFSGINKDKFVQILNSVISLNENTVKMPSQIIIVQFAQASLKTLDPHTTLIWPKQVEDFEKAMTNEFSGVGIEISKADGPLKAFSLLPGTPAYRSGIDAGDIIEAIDGEPTKDMTINCAVSKITGPANTKVVLTIKRQGVEDTIDFEITRAKIVVPTIRGWARDDSGHWQYMVDPNNGIGYIRLTSFSGTSAKDFEKALNNLESQGMNSLIFDLRYNSGGYLQTAADIVDMFVSEGVIVSSQPRLGLPTWEGAHKKGTHPNYPIIVLINGGSASASEIVSGALADKAYERATLIGTQSYGKGSVQTITDYPGGRAQLKYTMAHYHLPSGDKVKSRSTTKKQGKKDWGIMPHIKVELNSEELKKAIDIQRDNDILTSLNHDNTTSEVRRHNLGDTVQSDIQLAVAILVAKAKIIESNIKNK